jgi:protein RecA
MSIASKLAKAGISNDELAQVKAYLSTGYLPLDQKISGSYHNGGIPQGRITEISGPPSAGKTAIATCVMADAQKKGGFAAFHDHENTFDANQGEHLGLDVDPNKFLYQKPETFEQSVDKATEIAMTVREELGEEPPIVFVFDSLASMVPESKWNKEAANYNMNDTTALARATSAAFPTLAARAERFNLTFLFLNQVRTKPGVTYGNPETTPGGVSMEFYASVRVKLSKVKLQEKDAKREEGHGVKAVVEKNKVWRPFGEARWDFRHEVDGRSTMDVTTGVVDALIELGKIELSGSWVTFDGKKAQKAVFIRELREDPALLAKVLAAFPNDVTEDLTA